VAVAAAAAYFLLLYVVPPIKTYNTYQVRVFDYGIMYQSSYLLSELRSLFLTTRGVHAWADNQDYFQAVFALIHHLPKPHYCLLTFQALAIYGCGVLGLLFAWKHGALVAACVALTVWMSPVLINMNHLLHTEALTTILILFLYQACKRGSVPGFYAFLSMALACKEDVALSIGLFMVLALVERRRFRLPHRHFAVGLGLAVALFFFNLFVVLPHFKNETCLWLDPQADLSGMGAGPVAPSHKAVLSNWYRPAFLASAFFRPEVGTYLLKVLWPTVFFLRSASWLLLLPAAALFVNVVGEMPNLTAGFYHYDFVTMAAVIIIVLEGLAASAHKRTVAVLLVIGAVLAGSLAPIRVPLHAGFTRDFYRIAKAAEVRFLERLNEVLPEEATIAADHTSLNYLLDGHPRAYMFPSPLRPMPAGFGILGACTEFEDPPEVDLVLIRNERRVGPPGRWSKERTERLGPYDIVPPEFEFVSAPGDVFDVWLGPALRERPEGEVVRRLLEEPRLAR
jgi:uncharacterized membrane protein